MIEIEETRIEFGFLTRIVNGQAVKVLLEEHDERFARQTWRPAEAGWLCDSRLGTLASLRWTWLK